MKPTVRERVDPYSCPRVLTMKDEFSRCNRDRLELESSRTKREVKRRREDASKVVEKQKREKGEEGRVMDRVDGTQSKSAGERTETTKRSDGVQKEEVSSLEGVLTIANVRTALAVDPGNSFGIWETPLMEESECLGFGVYPVPSFFNHRKFIRFLRIASHRSRHANARRV